MDTHGVAHTPITNGEELLAKLNLILGAAQQWISDDDDDADELSLVILQRMREIGADVDAVLDRNPNFDLAPLGEKLLEIKEVMRQKSVNDLQSMFERS